MSVPLLVMPYIIDERDENIQHQLPEFSGTVSAIQEGILINPKLLLQYVEFAAGNLPVSHSAESEALFMQIALFIRDHFPEILVKKMPFGQCGTVTLLGTGKPLISISHDLVLAFENAASNNRAQLRVVVTTTILRELSQTINLMNPFIYGLWGETGRPGKHLFEDRVLRGHLGLYFVEGSVQSFSSFLGIFLTIGGKRYVPGEFMLMCLFYIYIN
jgi:hypothetical protein